MKTIGTELKRLHQLYRLTPEEVAIEAGMSIGNLNNVYRDNAPPQTVAKVERAIEACRRKLLSKLDTKTTA